MNHLREGIQAADDLWFGHTDVKRDRDAASALFDKLNSGGGSGSQLLDLDAAQLRREDGDNGGRDGNNKLSLAAPCRDGRCCEHRRVTSGSSVRRAASSSNKSICVVGAGPSGLITLRELQQRGFTQIKCYEASNHIGGAFATSYEDAVMTSSNILTAFGCYAVSEYAQKELGNRKRKNGVISDSEEEGAASNGAVMWTCNEYCSYLQSFA